MKKLTKNSLAEMADLLLGGMMYVNIVHQLKMRR